MAKTKGKSKSKASNEAAELGLDTGHPTNLEHPCPVTEQLYLGAIRGMAQVCRVWHTWKQLNREDPVACRDWSNRVSRADGECQAAWNAYCDSLIDHGTRLEWGEGELLGEVLARTVPGPLGMRFAALPSGAMVAIHTVTQVQYEVVMDAAPSFFSPTGQGADSVEGLVTSMFPVETVSWYDSVNFCRRFNHYFPGWKLRLPTEKEWEEACRAGTTTDYTFGDSLCSLQANFDGNYPSLGAPKGPYLQRTCRVGRYLPNAWGVYDMHGNVWEWCALDEDVSRLGFFWKEGASPGSPSATGGTRPASKPDRPSAASGGSEPGSPTPPSGYQGGQSSPPF